MSVRIAPAQEFSTLLWRLELLEQDAHRMGMHETAHAINAAKNKCGWERAGLIEKAADALIMARKP